MYRLRYRLRILLPPLLVGVLITLTVIVLNNGSLLRHVFYNYQINFHGVAGSYLSTKTPNESYCNFRYGLPEELLYEESDLIVPFEEKAKSPYRILQNVIEAKLDETVPEVTYVTHSTADFINYIAEIIRFWEGPVSVAAFVPDSDADLTIRQLTQLCFCAPEMGRVSVHFVFPLKEPPYLQNHQEKLTCELPDSAKLATFRMSNELMYPINICRNVARTYSQTDFVMVTDIQLIPSEDLASRFVKMAKLLHLKKSPSRVFVVPVFEVEAYDVIPRTKDELMMMVKEERAVYFHRHTCSHCQKFPGIKTWLESASGDTIKPFVSVKREYPFHRWEPIYIGGKTDPLYSELLSWEGLQDKMTQMLEMCLIGYQFIILDGAFLVHWPGIKKEKHTFYVQNSWRMSFQQENSKHYSRIIKELRSKYDDNPKCKLQ
ncbi:beta-1,4-glucuronyltransferase 1 isoform X2 [Tribolium castaneum]|uniref:N-acetyllactosaminide beta-1,3-N-acetylglucosaminyltransferase-like Protein n=1 Tax=Tribolium castaneum TaxID=7070 RepID=D1ZZK1_TRICA|nr:PREDICTED: beta-1,4-glucuronyltransferase 1 [Tribolium castaneum]EFA02383.1 N-acetyllactosaminide beta-1,3-N-acetylglucosaminyltransferase-like Protein [Tribolium castaneum]|eukprot:XP_001814629.1 PREDICTED: beta-1,4-glucuronyltransferase 1 [Tribolium castaneum]